MPTYLVTTGDGESHTITAPNVHIVSNIVLFVKGPTSQSEVVALFPVTEILSVVTEAQG